MHRHWKTALRFVLLCLLAVVLWREKPWTVALSPDAPWAVAASILLNLLGFLPLKAARWRVALIDPPPYRQVLGRLAGVPQWHLPAGEGGHGRPETHVHRVQRRLPRPFG